ncbi:hypothetical protein [Deinococcus humi]|uniref:Uncharacterized protein n=1 Tax=Deinococcus humi TaxID=662880 RepID=A0A7W8JRY1_9DEIO|nr:hypothetical protein [Deinococcus humi]MBB5362076.1 hypothetical protein [Deinococcus humi]GGO22172.1 hypothetical protein GCM10008949_09190 [Deinococcus humi]
MNRLPGLQATAQRLLNQNADLLYRHTDTWSDGTSCRFSVQDPNQTDQGTRLAQRLTGVPDVLDVRLLKTHPADPPPGEGASLTWDGGTLTLVNWGQVSDFTGLAVGVCRLVR